MVSCGDFLKTSLFVMACLLASHRTSLPLIGSKVVLKSIKVLEDEGYENTSKLYDMIRPTCVGWIEVLVTS